MTEPETPRVPRAVGSYRPAVWAGDFLFLSGQISMDPQAGNIVGSDVRAQTEQVLRNLSAVLNSEGLELKDVVKTTVFLTDIGDFACMDKVYSAFFGPVKPARSTVQVAALPAGARVEIEAVAYRGASRSS